MFGTPFKQRAHYVFNYKPRYFNERKERLEKLKEKYADDTAVKKNTYTLQLSKNSLKRDWSKTKKTMTDALGDHPHVGEIRGEGMICAVELVRDSDNRVFFDPADKIAPQIAASMASHGVIARAMPQGDIMGFAPPFCLTRQEADQIVETMVKAVKSTLG